MHLNGWPLTRLLYASENDRSVVQNLSILFSLSPPLAFPLQSAFSVFPFFLLLSLATRKLWAQTLMKTRETFQSRATLKAYMKKDGVHFQLQ